MNPNALPKELTEPESVLETSDSRSELPAQVRAQIFSRLSEMPESPELVGSHLINGKAYGLTESGMIYDLSGQHFVEDARLRDQVFDQHEETLRTKAAIQSKAKELAHGDPDMEAAFRLHFAFAGLPLKKAAVTEEKVA